MYLESYGVVLFWNVGIEPDDAHVEYVDWEAYIGVLAYFVPSLLHARRPMDIVENDDWIFVSFSFEKIEVVNRSLILVVGIDEDKVDLGYLLY